MKPGDLMWLLRRVEDPLLVTIIDVRYLNGQPEWVRILGAEGPEWTPRHLLQPVDGNDATDPRGGVHWI